VKTPTSNRQSQERKGEKKKHKWIYICLHCRIFGFEKQ